MVITLLSSTAPSVWPGGLMSRGAYAMASVVDGST